MDELRRETIEAKLRYLLDSLDHLEEILPPHRRKYEGDFVAQAAVERLCQVIVECSLDINSEILKGAAQSVPEKGRDRFTRVCELGILSREISLRFTRKNGHVHFRNLLVHLYDRVDPTAAYYTARRLRSDAALYATEIRRYLDSLEEANISPVTQPASSDPTVRPDSQNTQHTEKEAP